MRIFRSFQPCVYKSSGPKMAYVFTRGCSSAVEGAANALSTYIGTTSLNTWTVGNLLSHIYCNLRRENGGEKDREEQTGEKNNSNEILG